MRRLAESRDFGLQAKLEDGHKEGGQRSAAQVIIADVHALLASRVVPDQYAQVLLEQCDVLPLSSSDVTAVCCTVACRCWALGRLLQPRCAHTVQVLSSSLVASVICVLLAVDGGASGWAPALCGAFLVRLASCWYADMELHMVPGAC
jgi:hypothetical protein